MYKWLVFYNYFGNGDLFNSREFVKEISANLDHELLGYFHLRDRNIFEDLDFIYRLPNANCFPTKHFFLADNDLHINTWIGLDSNYVLKGIGCTIENNIRMYNNILVKAGSNFRLQGNLEDYIPKIDFTKIAYTDRIDNFVKQINKKIVIICNGAVLSQQAENFDFSYVIRRLMEKYEKDYFFITTEYTPDVYCTNDIFPQSMTFDLNQIAYLSKFANIIIGRSSGPYVFTQFKENLMDENKIFLTFTYNQNSSLFAKDIPLKAKTLWSDVKDENGVFNKICEVLG